MYNRGLGYQLVFTPVPGGIVQSGPGMNIQDADPGLLTRFIPTSASAPPPVPMYPTTPPSQPTYTPIPAPTPVFAPEDQRTTLVFDDQPIPPTLPDGTIAPTTPNTAGASLPVMAILAGLAWWVLSKKGR